MAQNLALLLSDKKYFEAWLRTCRGTQFVRGSSVSCPIRSFLASYDFKNVSISPTQVSYTDKMHTKWTVELPEWIKKFIYRIDSRWGRCNPSDCLNELRNC